MKEEAWALLVSQPVAILGTVSEDGTPHLVPLVFAAPAPNTLVTAVDSKPKSSRRLRRLENIERDSRVVVLAHHYEHDWSKLWWVRAEGIARVSDEPPPGSESLRAKYPQYEHHDLGPWIEINIHRIAGWSAAEPGT